MSPLAGLDELAWTSVMEGLVLGEYSLLLGAGASFGATNATGQSLPGGQALAEELLNKYRIPKPPPGSATLRTIYDLADQIARRDAIELPRTYLKRRFSGCSVPGWYENVVRIPWRVIFNLNIDDVLEHAYAVHATAAVQQLHVASWKAPEVFHREQQDRVTGVHLHGQASQGDLVFGSLEYLATAAHGGAGHRLFWDSWPKLPAIVVGASLSDEIDLAAPLNEVRLTQDEHRPSVIVLPHFSEFDEFRLKTAGLLPVPVTGERFLAAVRADWAGTVRRLDRQAVSTAQGVNPNRAYFFQHFRPLLRRDDRHDFFAGDEPTSADIQAGRDAARHLPALAAGGPLEDMPDNAVTVVAFVGSLSGTTTAELRYLKTCEDAGLQCFEYDANAAFSPPALTYAYQRDPALVCRLVDLADFGTALEGLVEACQKAGVTCRVVTAVRDDRLPTLAAAAGAALKVVEVADRLRDREIRSMLQTLERHDRLNVLRQMQPAERFGFFVKQHRRSLFESLAAASGGRGFLRRVRALYEDAVAADERELASLILIMSELGYPIPEGVAARALGRSASSVEQVLERQPLLGLAVIDRGLVSARQRSLAARISRDVVPAELRYPLTARLAQALSPYVSPSTIHARTRAVRIVARLMDAQVVFNWFGSDVTDAWYEGIKGDYGWNARFWEQRALAECLSDDPRFERAESWAREAVARHHDAYSLNTLGTVLLRRSTSGSLDEELLRTGLAQVAEAAQALRRPSEHPYVTAFSYLRRAYRLGDEGERRRLRAVYNGWADDARHSSAWRLVSTRQLIEEHMTAFLVAATGD